MGSNERGSHSTHYYMIVVKSLYVDGIVQAVKVKVKVKPLHAYADIDGRGRYSSNSFASSVLQQGWVVSATPWPLYPWERPGTHCAGRRMALGACPYERGISHLHQDSILGLPIL